MRDELGKILRHLLHCPACGPAPEAMMMPALPFRSENGGGKASARVVAHSVVSGDAADRDQIHNSLIGGQGEGVRRP